MKGPSRITPSGPTSAYEESHIAYRTECRENSAVSARRGGNLSPSGSGEAVFCPRDE